MPDQSPTITAAVIAGLVSIIGIIISIAMTYAKMGSAERKSKAELDQAADRLRREFQLEFTAESAARALLEDIRWELRTFETIKRHLGGFEDNELRRLLVRAGAVRFEGSAGRELWGLLSRNRKRLGRVDAEDDSSTPIAFMLG